MNTISRKFLALCLITIVFCMPMYTKAQTEPKEYALLEPLPCVQGTATGNKISCEAGKMTDTVNINEYIQYAFNLMIAIAAVLAVIMIVYGGIVTMTTDSVSGRKEGISKVKNAVYGLIFVLFTFIILKTVNPELVKIPTTLVPSLKSPIIKVTDFYDKLSGDTTLYNQIDSARREVNRQYDADITRLTKELSDLQYVYTQAKIAGKDPEEITRTETQIFNKQNEINTLKATKIVTDANFYFQNTIENMDLTKTNTSIDWGTKFTIISGLEKNLTNKYNAASTELKKTNNAQFQNELKNNYFDKYTSIVLTKNSPNFIGNIYMIKDRATALDNISKLRSGILQNVTDMTLQQSLIKKIDEQVKFIDKPVPKNSQERDFGSALDK